MLLTRQTTTSTTSADFSLPGGTTKPYRGEGSPLDAAITTALGGDLPDAKPQVKKPLRMAVLGHKFVADLGKFTIKLGTSDTTGDKSATDLGTSDAAGGKSNMELGRSDANGGNPAVTGGKPVTDLGKSTVNGGNSAAKLGKSKTYKNQGVYHVNHP
jgi:hypothetical protein